MDIEISPIPDRARREKPKDESQLEFGKIYSDHMFTMHWTPGDGWSRARVGPFAPFKLSPASLALHYGQTIFEGLKAYANPAGGINLFRPLENCSRFNRSAARLALPAIEEQDFMQALESLLNLDRDWVPKSPGTSLYIRPAMIAAELDNGQQSAGEVSLYIITSPVGAYYTRGFNPVSITVSEKFSRAAPGGLGGVKTGANYAASLLATHEAHDRGFAQVLWLDSVERKYVEEVGAMNIFFNIDGVVITPPLRGATILPGITRDSVIHLLKHWDIPVYEDRISIEEVLHAHRAGTLEEVFGTGTAAVITPVGTLDYRGQSYSVAGGGTGPLTMRMFEELSGIQTGTRPDPFRWIHEIPPHMRARNSTIPMDAV